MRKNFFAILFLATLIMLIAATIAVATIDTSKYDEIITQINTGYSYLIKSDGTKQAFTCNNNINVFRRDDQASYTRVLLVYVKNTVNATITFVKGGGNNYKYAVLEPGLYYAVGYWDTADYYYVYIYNKNTLYASIKSPFSGYTTYAEGVYAFITPNTNICVLQLYEATTAPREKALNYYINNIMPFWQGNPGFIILLFNMSGNQPLSYSYEIKNVSNALFSFGGGSTTYALVYVNATNITITGSITQTFGPGLYYIENTNWWNVSTGSGSTTPQQQYWLNTTVSPPQYEIKYYVNNQLNVSGVGHLEQKFANNTVVTVKIYDNNGVLKATDTVTVTRDTVRHYVFENNTNVQLSISVFDENGTEIVADRVCVDYTCVSQRHTHNFTVSAAETHNIVVEKQGFKTFSATIKISSDTYLPVFLAASESNATSGVGGAYEEPQPQPPTPSAEVWFGFKIINKASTQKTVIIKAKKSGSLFTTWHYEVPLRTVNVAANDVQFVWISEDEVNDALGYNWFEWGDSFVIYVDETPWTEVKMDTAKNTWVTVWITEASGVTFGYGAFPSGGTELNTNSIVNLVIALLPVFLILAVISMIFKMIQKLAR